MVPDLSKRLPEARDYPWYVQAALVLFTILSVPALIALPFGLGGFLIHP